MDENESNGMVGTFKTVCGYPVDELVFFAKMCERHGITEDELHDYCAEARNGYVAGMQDWRIARDNMAREMMQRFTSNARVFNLNIGQPITLDRDRVFTINREEDEHGS